MEWRSFYCGMAAAYAGIFFWDSRWVLFVMACALVFILQKSTIGTSRP